jgi:hypothetical protein
MLLLQIFQIVRANTALSLPDRVCVVYGLSRARGGTSPILVERTEPLITLLPAADSDEMLSVPALPAA